MNRMNRINEKDYSRNLPLLFGSTSQFYPEPFQLSINASGAPFKVQIRHVPHRNLERVLRFIKRLSCSGTTENRLGFPAFFDDKAAAILKLK